MLRGLCQPDTKLVNGRQAYLHGRVYQARAHLARVPRAGWFVHKVAPELVVQRRRLHLAPPARHVEAPQACWWASGACCKYVAFESVKVQGKNYVH